MPISGISIKLWTSDYDPSKNEFLTSDSVAYVFQDRSQEDILYISGVVKQLTGDDSLDQIFIQNMPSVKGKSISCFVEGFWSGQSASSTFEYPRLIYLDSGSVCLIWSLDSTPSHYTKYHFKPNV